MAANCWKHFILLFLVTGIFSLVNAQQGDTNSYVQNEDSSKGSSFFRKWKMVGEKETLHSLEKYKAGQIAIKQQQLIDDIRTTSQHAKIYLRKGIDSHAINRHLDQVEAYIRVVNDGVFVNAGTAQTQRNLAVSSAILTELLFNTAAEKDKVVTYTNNLVNFRDRIDSLSVDSALYTFPKDSIAIIKYLKRLQIVAKDLGPVDTMLDQSLANIQNLRSRAELLVFSLGAELEEVERKRADLTEHTFDQMFPYISGPVNYSRPFLDIIKSSLAKEKLALSFYIRDNIERIFILLVLLAFTIIFIRSFRQKMVEKLELHPDFNGQLVLRSPILSGILLNTSLFQFIFLDPPFIFSFVLWLIAAICLAFIFRGFISVHWMRFWIVTIILFTLASFDNMILQASREERWIMLVLSVTGVIYGTYILAIGKRFELKEKGILLFIAFMVLVECAASLFNIFGRYNLSKTLLISGYSGVVIAILFLWTVRLINELLGLTSRLYKHPEKKLFYIDFDRLGDKVPGILYIFLVLGWFILVGRNSYAFKQIVNPFNDFLTTERTLGDYSFTINGLFIFILILTSSMLLSRIISFFAAEPGEKLQNGKNSGRIELGSWLLLIRIFIISMGLFLAFAASGIPLDKITIILGALGVGIGLGLQGLVNNLVSGLIIAFEKPVNVGDLIEVNGKPGTMKSIGFRSSVVTLSDGASLIIPNGDLLSQHLVNWTMGKNIKRLSVSFGVAYGSDLVRVKQLVNQLLEADQRILDNPSPLVVANEFAPSSINFEILFWVKLFTESHVIKSEVITKIDECFKAEGIVIPMPQQELHIHNLTKTNQT